MTKNTRHLLTVALSLSCVFLQAHAREGNRSHKKADANAQVHRRIPPSPGDPVPTMTRQERKKDLEARLSPLPVRVEYTHK